jgi:hypothetical protein
MFIETVPSVFQLVKRSFPEVGVFRCCLLILLLIPIRTANAQTAARFETPPTLPAQELAPASLLNGNGFHVDQEVPTDGLTAHFTLRSDVGTFNADGLEMLRIRVAEIPAIMELNQTSKTKVFAQALAANAAAPVAAAGQMVMHPVDTVTGLPAGVGRFFGRVGLGAQKIKEAATTPEEASAGEKAGQVASRTFHTSRDVLGYEQERRGLAKKLHVDPYTTNPILSKQLDDFALVAFRAHVGVTTTMSVFIPGSMAITATRVVSTWVYDTPRADLIVQNQKKLQEMNVPDASIHAFMDNKAFPLSVQTAFVEDLTRVSGVPGSIDIVALVSTAESEDQARFLASSLDMLANYHQSQTPLASIIARGTIIGRDRAGVVVVPAEVDYVSWTKRTSYFANRPDLVSPKRSAWLSGQMSPLAKKNFQALGWNVHEKTKLLTQAARATRNSGQALNEGANRRIASDRQWASSGY